MQAWSLAIRSALVDCSDERFVQQAPKVTEIRVGSRSFLQMQSLRLSADFDLISQQSK